MKKIIRSMVAWLVGLTNKYACTTYGDVAELSAGPCARCVGKQVIGPTTNETPNVQGNRRPATTDFQEGDKA